MKKVFACILLLLASKAFAQTSGLIDGATGNLVYTTVNPPPPGVDPFSWSGFMNTTLNGGGYSDGYMPGYNPSTGTFMFGYTQGTVSYSTPVNYALSVAGTGIQVNGFKYSWEYLNQDMSRGTLTGNISLTSTSGQTLQSYNYNMPRTTNGWTLMSGTENFNTQYPASSVGSLNVSFTGKDDRWWAGYYGPQVRAIDVSLLYSVAPPPPIPTDFARWVKLTDENGDFTLSKPGVVRYGADGTYIYQSLQAGTYSCSNSAWGKDPLGGVYKECDLGSNYTPPPTTTVTTNTTTTTTDYTSGVPLQDPVTAAPTTTTTTASTTPVTTTTDTSTSISSASVQPGTVTASPTIVSAPAPTTTSGTTTTASSTTATSTQSSSKESSSSGGGTVSLALSVISKNQERDATTAAVAQTAMAQANQAAAQAQQDATNVASSAVSNSLSAGTTISLAQQSSGTGIKTSSSGGSFTLQSGISTLSNMPGVQASVTSVAQQSFGNTTTATYSAQQSFVANTQQSTSSTSSISILQPQQVASYSLTNVASATTNQKATQSNTSLQTAETYSVVTSGSLTDRSNPLNDIVESKLIGLQNTNQPTTGPVVNKNAQDSELAGGVSLNKIALAPTGYGDYLNFVMKDAAFYAPKEVYKNQRNVDNARALRQMTNDSKHREMVELQYTK